MNKPVDVLIIGAGASGAAVAWSLAETKMHILCLDQGGWMKQSEYPSNGRDWEAKFYGEWSTSPNIRGRPEDYPINDDNSPIKVVNFNAVGGSTIMYTAHWPRLHPTDFRVKTLDGVADDWPIDYDALTPFFEENDRMMGVSGLSGDPQLAAVPSADAAAAARALRSADRQGHEQARLALVAVGHDGRDHRLRGQGALHQSRPLHAGLRARRQSLDRHHLLAAARSAPASSCARTAGCARSPSTSTAWPPARSITIRTARSNSRRLRSSSSPATASARRGCCSTRSPANFRTGLPIRPASSART